MTKAQGRQHSKNKAYYDRQYGVTTANKARRLATRKRKAESDGAARRILVREAKHLASLAGAPARIAARLAKAVASNA